MCEWPLRAPCSGPASWGAGAALAFVKLLVPLTFSGFSQRCCPSDTRQFEFPEGNGLLLSLSECYTMDTPEMKRPKDVHGDPAEKGRLTAQSRNSCRLAVAGTHFFLVSQATSLL